MDLDRELGRFLSARRAEISPPDAPAGHRRRRVPGLRREEVAAASGVSLDYYARLEQGRDLHPSAQVLHALAGPLRLTAVELRYLMRLAEPAATVSRHATVPVRAGLVDLLARLHDVPALVVNRRRDVLAANQLAGALCPAYVTGVNICRFVFADGRAREIYLDWEDVAAQCVGSLRSALAADPCDPELSRLLDALALHPDFTRLWDQPIVREKTDGLWRFHRPGVGTLSLAYESLSVSADPDQTLVAYRAAPGGDDERALALLGALAATEATVSI